MSFKGGSDTAKGKTWTNTGNIGGNVLRICSVQGKSLTLIDIQKNQNITGTFSPPCSVKWKMLVKLHFWVATKRPLVIQINVWLFHWKIHCWLLESTEKLCGFFVLHCSSLIYITTAANYQNCNWRKLRKLMKSNRFRVTDAVSAAASYSPSSWTSLWQPALCLFALQQLRFFSVCIEVKNEMKKKWDCQVSREDLFGSTTMTTF